MTRQIQPTATSQPQKAPLVPLCFSRQLIFGIAKWLKTKEPDVLASRAMFRPLST